MLAHPKDFIKNNVSPPHFLPFYHVEIDIESGSKFKDFAVKISTLELHFTLKEVSMFFLLHLNEDFDDDLLSDAVELIE